MRNSTTRTGVSGSKSEQRVFKSIQRIRQLRRQNQMTESEYRGLLKACLAIWVAGQFEEIMRSFMADLIKGERNA